jgi:hypothetical protein
MADPLKKGPESARVLFDTFSKAANGFSHDDAIGAGGNIVLNGIRQSCATKKEADQALDIFYQRARELLDHHYDPATGKRRNVFPFAQHIQVGPINFKNKIMGN